MKKLLSIALIASIGMATAASFQVFYKGAWESTVQYRVTPIAGSTTKTSPSVKDGFAVYIANGASTPTKGVHPAAQPAAWDIYGTQLRTGTAATGVIAPAAVASITVTYSSVCPTASNTITLGMVEPSVGLPVGYKVKTQSASGFVAEVENLLASGASTQAGTLNYTVNCN